MSMQEVVEAGAFLDKYCDNLAWRTKVNTSRLDMDSTLNCILGQVYGSYYSGVTALENAAGTEEWNRVKGAFSDYDTDWEAYLTIPRELVQKSGEFTGERWTRKNPANHRTDSVNAMSSFTADSVRHVVFRVSGDNGFIVMTEADFRAKYQPGAVYAEGGIYRGKGGQILVYGEKAYVGEPGFYYLNHDNTVTYCGVSYFEQNFGPILPVNGIGNYSGKHFTVTK